MPKFNNIKATRRSNFVRKEVFVRSALLLTYSKLTRFNFYSPFVTKISPKMAVTPYCGRKIIFSNDSKDDNKRVQNPAD